jgi:hypothetical protein
MPLDEEQNIFKQVNVAPIKRYICHRMNKRLWLIDHQTSNQFHKLMICGFPHILFFVLQF